jgi:hypothetical protein
MHTKNRMLSLFVFFSLAMVTMPIQSMESPKKIIIKLPSTLQCAALYVSCAVCGLAIGTIGKQAEWGKKEDVSADIREFVHATLQEHGIAQDKVDAIKIKENDCWQAGHGYMGVPYFTWLSLYFKEWQLSGWEKKINIAKMAILHEYGHILNKDKLYFNGACIIAPFMAYGLWQESHKIISKRLPPLSAEFVRGGAIAWITFGLLTIYKKYREHKADMVVVQLCKNPDMLQHASEFYFERHKESSLAQISNPCFQKWYVDNVVFRELILLPFCRQIEFVVI